MSAYRENTGIPQNLAYQEPLLCLCRFQGALSGKGLIGGTALPKIRTDWDPCGFPFATSQIFKTLPFGSKVRWEHYFRKITNYHRVQEWVLVEDWKIGKSMLRHDHGQGDRIWLDLINWGLLDFPKNLRNSTILTLYFSSLRLDSRPHGIMGRIMLFP